MDPNKVAARRQRDGRLGRHEGPKVKAPMKQPDCHGRVVPAGAKREQQRRRPQANAHRDGAGKVGNAAALKPSRRHNDRGLPEEAVRLLEEGGGEKEDESAALYAWGCWLGIVGVLIVLILGASVVLVAKRNVRLQLQSRNPASRALVGSAAMGDGALGSAICNATHRASTNGFSSSDGYVNLQEILGPDSCCNRCEVDPRCKAWAWVEKGSQAGCWLEDAEERREDAGDARDSEEAKEATPQQPEQRGEDSEEAKDAKPQPPEVMQQGEDAGDSPDSEEAKEAALQLPDPVLAPLPTPSPTPCPPPPAPVWHSPWSGQRPSPAPSQPATAVAKPPRPSLVKPEPPAEDGCQVGDQVPEITPHSGGVAANLKVLSYNLFWWNLFGVRNGDGDKAAHLIAETSKQKPYDLMGFQECEDVNRVLGPVSLIDQYFVFSGSGKTQAICIAARKESFELLSHGMQIIAEDSKDQYYGKRAAQWMRLKHLESGQLVFFINHHGPLPVNSGGVCGGPVTAHKLLQLIAAKMESGDAVIVVGDFNAGDGSATIQRLEHHLHRIYHGVSDGGIDNFFSNTDPASVQSTNLGSGGSDHDALSVELQIGGGPEAPAEDDASRMVVA